jgi:hypothetical protein
MGNISGKIDDKLSAPNNRKISRRGGVQEHFFGAGELTGGTRRISAGGIL